MGLKAFVNDINEVDESARGFYVQDGERYKLDAEGLLTDGDVSGLKSALQKERDRAKQLEKLAKSAEGVDIEEYQRLREEAEQRSQKEAEKKGEWDKLREQLVKNHQKEIESRETKLSTMQKSLESYLIDANATAEIAGLNGIPGLLLPHVKSQLKVVEQDGKYVVRVVDSDGDVRIDAKSGEPMSIKQLVAEMRDSETFAPAFKGSGASGSGTPPNSSAGRAGHGVKRGQMTQQQKAAFIHEHGRDAYRQLPT